MRGSLRGELQQVSLLIAQQLLHEQWLTASGAWSQQAGAASERDTYAPANCASVSAGGLPQQLLYCKQGTHALQGGWAWPCECARAKVSMPSDALDQSQTCLALQTA